MAASFHKPLLWVAGEKQIRLLGETSAAQSRDIMKASIDVAERALVAGQRPWIHVDMALDGDVVFDASGARVPLMFVLKNIGRSPATNVLVNPSIFLQSIKRPDPRIEHQIFCAMVRTRTDITLSYTLFPDEEPKRIPILETISFDQIKELQESWKATTGDDWNHFSPLHCRLRQLQHPL